MTDIEITTEINGRPVSREERLEKELERARVALALLKEAIGPNRMRDLLQEDLQKSDQDYVTWYKSAGNGCKQSQTKIRVKGMKAGDFLQWFGRINQQQDIAALLAANPEHYLILPNVRDGQRGQELIETMGMHGQPVHFQLTFPDTASLEPGLLDTSYPYGMVAFGTLSSNGMDVGVRAVHQFRDTEDGFEAQLMIQFPDGAPDELVEGHQWHLAIEFNNWIQACQDSFNH